ncbi:MULTISPECIES: YoaK family protein [unclassified Acinetobacter]|uniref:YoaK family protein n=1 Tax=unclassified Acinetobacter TaxID=196816 RepID=UPI0015D3F9E0|nr:MULTISPECIES: YoaK family protein [unclassified Acinetobacter]
MPFQTLPLWIQLGAFFLAVNAGMINVLGLVTILHQSVSHMTGNVSMLAMALIAWQPATIIYLILVLLCYVIGSFYSGLILGNSHFSLTRRYGVPLSLVAFFIVLCWLLLPYFPRYALLWACVAMGVQNAMVSHYKGTIIRTTHLSGVLTDLGLALGYKARGLSVESKRVVLHLLILAGFIVGGILASWLYPYLKLNAFLIPAALSVVMSAVYWIIYFHYRHIHD